MKPMLASVSDAILNPGLDQHCEPIEYFAEMGMQGSEALVLEGRGNLTCGEGNDLKEYQHFLYAVTYAVILLPGLVGNMLALWVFRAYVRETKKAVVFMINLAVADLLQLLSLPLRIYYYLKDTWPFGNFLCMFCFYLKYVNMYASIYFLVCISIRRCTLATHPLRHSSNKSRFDQGICVAGWLVVGIGCLPFPLLRRGTNENQCFSELPLAPLSMAAGVTAIVLAELLGFVLPLAVVLTCSWRTAASLRESSTTLQRGSEKRKALRTVLSCAAVFLVCFAPYHLTFPLHFLAKADSSMIDCTFRNAIFKSHPITLCLASFNSCLDPIIHYFTTDEFKRRLSRHDISESLHLYGQNRRTESIIPQLELGA
ncbi:probable G-protein coupled receptor 174 [Scleropages formosus]|uniref:Probable G-protein coupled receptor 174 n=2 Tax=Scleropages formosus TaxID=113540 RepID=A0A8C9RL15_SCLFO|nr:probable G-protein coupled receptor 174 [Scleropages formosus]